jgi:hypothetical protein
MNLGDDTAEENLMVPSIEEVKRLFAELPKGKYAWGVYAQSKDQYACWFYPHIMTGEAKDKSGDWGWQLVCINKELGNPDTSLPLIIMIWLLRHPKWRGFFAFCVPDHIKKVTSKLEKEAMRAFAGDA